MAAHDARIGKFGVFVQRRIGLGNHEFIFRVSGQVFNFIRNERYDEDGRTAQFLDGCDHFSGNTVTLLGNHFAGRRIG